MEKIYWSERIVHFLIGIMSVFIMVLSASYGLGTLAQPRPGLYPFAVGLFILPFSILLFISSLRRETNGAILDGRGIRIFLAFIGTCLFWILAMPYLGYPVVTFIAVFALSKIMKLEGWLKPLILAAGTALFVYLLFDIWLYVDLPRGVWGEL
jgi:putative tricarboxylic transport membrane protein